MMMVGAAVRIVVVLQMRSYQTSATSCVRNRHGYGTLAHRKGLRDSLISAGGHADGAACQRMSNEYDTGTLRPAVWIEIAREACCLSRAEAFTRTMMACKPSGDSDRREIELSRASSGQLRLSRMRMGNARMSGSG